MKHVKIAGLLFIGAVALVFLLPGSLAWSENGVAVCTATQNQGKAIICADGQGGSFIAWVDSRSGIDEIFLQRLGPEGNLLWAANGIHISRDVTSDYNVQMVKASDDGVILAWTRGGGTGATCMPRR